MIRRVACGLVVIAVLALILWIALASETAPVWDRRSSLSFDRLESRSHIETPSPTTPGETASGDFIRIMNIGKGYVDNRASAKAIEVLTQAVRLQPDSAPALRNLARAHLIPKKARNYLVAVDLLERAGEVNPGSPATRYLLGLALGGVERFEESVAAFEQAVRLDPDTAALRYQLADALQKTGQHDRAMEQLEETILLDPTHTAAYYKMASYARRRRDREAVLRLTREFQRLKRLLGIQPEDILERCIHTQAEPGPTDEMVAKVPSPSEQHPEGIDVRWTDVTDHVFRVEGDQAATTAAVIEVDKLGFPTLFAAGPDGSFNLLKMTDSDTFARTIVRRADPDRPVYTACAIGDVFIAITRQNKAIPKLAARNDVLLIGPGGVVLLERTGDASFVDRTATAGLAEITGRAAKWVDYDHNGVLDLIIAGDDGVQLWQNNSYVIRFDTAPADVAQLESAQTGTSDDIRLVNVTDEIGLTAAGPIWDVASLEWDNNMAIDIIAAGGDSPTRVFMNQRAGRFHPMAEPPGPWTPARRIAVNDLNNDGYTDAVLISSDHALCMFGRSGQRHRFEYPDLDARGAVLVDYDNDGWLDVCVYGGRRNASGRGSMRLWRNLGALGWKETTQVTGLDALQTAAVVDAVAADFDADGDTDLLLITADQTMRLLRNDGGNANGQLKVRLVTILTNPTGLGNHIELRKGNFWVTRMVTHVPIEIGVGQSRQLDTVHTLWTNGVVDNEFLVSPTLQPLEFVEKMVELGSCPFLFAFNGERFRFVTDILGNAPLGLSLRRDEILPADNDELVYVGDMNDFVPTDGAYLLEVAECYREVLYLDAAELVAVDHPPDVEIHPTDKLMPPPFPPSELWALTDLRAPHSAVGDDGIDRTAAVAEMDGVFAPPGETLPPPFRGMCHPMTLTMDFGNLDHQEPLVLALTGWLRYGSASVNIALSQNPGVKVIPPTLEAETHNGTWTPVDVVVGMPAGKTKTILCNLTGELPPGPGRLRLTSTFEIRWDRIALGRRRPSAERLVHRIQPASADVYFRGFPEMRTRAPHHPITPDYHVLTGNPQWRTTPQGWCTRYGDALELVARSDGKLAILNGGDAVTLRYPADKLPPLDRGMIRSFFFYSVGWEKDADYNVVNGDTVEPLPIAEARIPMHDEDWRLKYNTRWVPRDAFHPRR
ncbi:MAG: FG-GAP-like repeat-containing protein [Phycisphaerae bacterium]